MKMHKAFTMLELVFVIVIVGILSVMIAPNFQGNNLREAADQVVSHIRYTQHLAMMDNKFSTTENNWFLRRWTIRFQQNVTFGGIPNNGVWTYTVYSDIPNFNGHNPDIVGMAKNPLNGNQFLSGGYDNTLSTEDTRAMKELQLGESYGITNIAFTRGCRADTMFISFDYIGRPFNSFPNANVPYQVGGPGWHRLLTQECDIILSIGADSETIRIEPETGYTHILKNN